MIEVSDKFKHFIFGWKIYPPDIAENVSSKNNQNHAPIFMLPEEILLSIFLLNAGTYYESRTTTRISSQVCHQWRTLALSCSLLWSHIDIRRDDGYPKWREEMLLRSAKVPIDVNVEEPAGFRSLSQHMSRFRAVTAPMVFELEFISPTGLLDFLRSPAPNLEVLNLRGKYPYPSYPKFVPISNLFDNEAPKLHSLQLSTSNCMIDLFSPCLNQLTSLSLEGIQRDTTMSAFDCLRMLSGMPLLELLYLSEVISDTPTNRNDNSYTNVDLPNLRSFTLRETAMNCGALASCISLPTSCNMTLCCQSINPETADTIGFENILIAIKKIVANMDITSAPYSLSMTSGTRLVVKPISRAMGPNHQVPPMLSFGFSKYYSVTGESLTVDQWQQYSNISQAICSMRGIISLTLNSSQGAESYENEISEYSSRRVLKDCLRHLVHVRTVSIRSEGAFTLLPWLGVSESIPPILRIIELPAYVLNPDADFIQRVMLSEDPGLKNNFVSVKKLIIVGSDDRCPGPAEVWRKLIANMVVDIRVTIEHSECFRIIAQL